MQKPPSHWYNDRTIAYEKSFISANDDVTSDHGIKVFDLLSVSCQEATISFYQAINEDWDLNLVPFVQAVEAVISDNIHILNISCGRHRPNCRGGCGFCRATQGAINNNVVVVTAAGNQRQNADTQSVYCPSHFSETISVSAFDTQCTAEYPPVNYIGGLPGRSPPTIRPPGAYWTDNELRDGSLTAGKYYCGQHGCSASQSCDAHRLEQPWEGNISPAGGKPEIVAPHHVPYQDGTGKWTLDYGTSFAAAFVSGMLTAIVGELFSKGKPVPPPYQMRDAIIDGSKPLDTGNTPKLDVIGTLDELI